MPLTQNLCEQVSQLREASRTIVRELGLLETKNPYAEASMPQIHALIELARHSSLTAAALARLLNLNQSSTCRTIAELRRLGWVQNVVLPNDRKQKPVALTDEGRAKLSQIESSCGNLYQLALAHIPPEKRQGIVEAFMLYAEALQQLRDTETVELAENTKQVTS